MRDNVDGCIVMGSTIIRIFLLGIVEVGGFIVGDTVLQVTVSKIIEWVNSKLRAMYKT